MTWGRRVDIDKIKGDTILECGSPLKNSGKASAIIYIIEWAMDRRFNSGRML